MIRFPPSVLVTELNPPKVEYRIKQINQKNCNFIINIKASPPQFQIPLSGSPDKNVTAREQQRTAGPQKAGMVALPDKLRDREHVAVIDTTADEIQQPRADEPRDNRHSDHGGPFSKTLPVYPRMVAADTQVPTKVENSRQNRISVLR